MRLRRRYNAFSGPSTDGPGIRSERPSLPSARDFPTKIGLIGDGCERFFLWPWGRARAVNERVRYGKRFSSTLLLETNDKIERPKKNRTKQKSERIKRRILRTIFAKIPRRFAVMLRKHYPKSGFSRINGRTGYARPLSSRHRKSYARCFQNR